MNLRSTDFVLQDLKYSFAHLKDRSEKFGFNLPNKGTMPPEALKQNKKIVWGPQIEKIAHPQIKDFCRTISNIFCDC